MILLLHAIISCLAAYTTLVSPIFGIAIPTSFSILLLPYYNFWENIMKVNHFCMLYFRMKIQIM
ncbi:MAG: hypothetical protein ETSY2_42405 [Candidatus Entotheonella gemina]|uniref:Uncharacterized protein n=1 Tax=Candidatus Entotheonella gemina TaxID=1429439 RepID=W4LL26_9BACT|nr:MAG: hypothetical protein ETSY2_42405 [Candidatus Entotheonella gemina]